METVVGMTAIAVALLIGLGRASARNDPHAAGQNVYRRWSA